MMMWRKAFILIPALFSVVANSSIAQDELVVGYWNEAAPPFAFRSEQVLTGGIIKELGDGLAQRMQVSVSYKLLPVKRIERELKSGAIHLDCVTSPIWKDDPKAYRWSPALFPGADRFLVRKGAKENIQTISQLDGKLVGVYSGYVYHPDIMAMFDSGKATAVQVDGIEKGVELLQIKRIDALIDFGVLLSHQIKTKKMGSELTLADKHADDFELMCAYSPKMPFDPAVIDQHFLKMVEDKTITKILSNYR